MPPEISREKKKTSIYESLLNITTALNSELNIYQLLPLIMLYSKDLLRAEASSLFLLDESAENLYCEVAMGEKGDIIQKYLRLPVGSGIAGWVAKNRHSVLIKDAYEDERFNSEYDKKTGFRTKSLICVPLFVKEKLLGTLEVINKVGGETFDSDDLEHLSMLADNAAVAIENARLHEGLRKRVLELSLLYEFEQILLDKSALPEIADWLLDRCLDHMEALSGTIYRYNPDSETLTILSAKGIPKEDYHKIIVHKGHGIAGWVAEEKEPLLVPNLQLDPRYDKNAAFTFESNSLISAPLIWKGDLLGIISINNKKSGFAFAQYDLTILVTIAQRLAATLKNHELFQRVKINAEDKERAARVMKQIIPDQLPERNGIQIITGYFPLENIGGDFYQIFPITGSKTGIMLADVVGHGMSSALLSIMIYTMLKSFSAELYEKPSELLTILNNELHGYMAGNFVTIFYAVIDTEDNTIRFGNGGHSPALVYKKASDDVEILQAKGKLIGFLPSLVFEEKKTSFLPGDRLFLYTDGLMELAIDRRSCLLEEDKLIDILKNTYSDVTPELPARILTMVEENCPKARFDDDISMLIINRTES